MNALAAGETSVVVHYLLDSREYNFMNQIHRKMGFICSVAPEVTWTVTSKPTASNQKFAFTTC